jgi:hypothetical protein
VGHAQPFQLLRAHKMHRTNEESQWLKMYRYRYLYFGSGSTFTQKIKFATIGKNSTVFWSRSHIILVEPESEQDTAPSSTKVLKMDSKK